MAVKARILLPKIVYPPQFCCYTIVHLGGRLFVNPKRYQNIKAEISAPTSDFPAADVHPRTPCRILIGTSRARCTRNPVSTVMGFPFQSGNSHSLWRVYLNCFGAADDTLIGRLPLDEVVMWRLSHTKHHQMLSMPGPEISQLEPLALTTTKWSESFPGNRFDHRLRSNLLCRLLTIHTIKIMHFLLIRARALLEP